MSFHLKNVAAAAAVIAAALAFAACSGSKDKHAEQQNDELTQALSEGDISGASRLAESMALYVDDLSPEETVMVLTAFLEAHNQSDGKDLETMRKYVDVYDIAMSIHGDDLRHALAGAKRLNGEADFEQAAIDFRRALAEYDALKTYGETPVEEPTDSAAAEPADSTATAANVSDIATD